MSVSRRQMEMARERGAAARRAGKPSTACPDYGTGYDGNTLAEWRTGWESENKGEGRSKR